MKILHIGKYYPPFSGGIENFMGELLPLLSSNNNTICALIHDHSRGQDLQKETINNIQVIRVPCHGQLLYAPISPAFPVYLQRTIKQFKPDIIHVHMPNTSAFWLLFSSIAKNIPWIIHWHSDVIGSAPNKLVTLAYYLYQPFERLLLKKSKQIIVTSPHYQKSSSVLKPWLHKTQVIPLGLQQQQVNITNKDRQYAKQLWHNNKHRFLSVGRLAYYKGHKYLIKAMQELPESQLIIVGHGEEYTALQKLITKLGLNKQVILAGKLSDQKLHALLASCDIFCLPSIERTEAFGLVLLEAMYYAKPTIVSNIAGSGMTWVCQNNITGMHTPAADHYNLAKTLKVLSNNTKLCHSMGQNGKKRVEQDFNIQVIAKNILRQYYKIVPD